MDDPNQEERWSMAEMRLPSRAVGTALILGLAGAGLAAFAAMHGWYAVASSAPPLRAVTAGEAFRPIAVSVPNAPNLVVLAFLAVALWGAALVGRRWMNRLVGIFLVLLSAGVLAAGLAALTRVPYGMHVSGGWAWVALIGSLLSLLAAMALLLVRAP